MENFDFGKNLEKIREYRGLTQQNVADALNVSQPTYARIEANLRKATEPDLQNLQKKLEVTREQLFTDFVIPGSVQVAGTIAASVETQPDITNVPGEPSTGPDIQQVPAGPQTLRLSGHDFAKIGALLVLSTMFMVDDMDVGFLRHYEMSGTGFEFRWNAFLIMLILVGLTYQTGRWIIKRTSTAHRKGLLRPGRLLSALRQATLFLFRKIAKYLSAKHRKSD